MVSTRPANGPGDMHGLTLRRQTGHRVPVAFGAEAVTLLWTEPWQPVRQSIAEAALPPGTLGEAVLFNVIVPDIALGEDVEAGRMRVHAEADTFSEEPTERPARREPPVPGWRRPPLAKRCSSSARRWPSRAPAPDGRGGGFGRPRPKFR